MGESSAQVSHSLAPDRWTVCGLGNPYLAAGAGIEGVRKQGERELADA
jgi:hypothetical protein